MMPETSPPLTPQIIMLAYANGLFPMADAAESLDYFWVDPEMRGQLSIPNLHIPSRLKRTVLSEPYRVTINTAFDQIIDMCAATARGRDATWINQPIRDVFVELHKMGITHSVECWDGDRLVGGLYGLAMGQVFCGESMVSRATDASKIALVHLCARLHHTGFTVLDTQFVNDHLQQFGCHEVPRETYHDQLRAGLNTPCNFTAPTDETTLINSYFQMREQVRRPSD